ncbi:hypothetical protein MNBD_NITROSPIRAE01-742 [hydrothermal vent metagenome]|uniref:Serine aminopeptidase S33 domain-containing protein n=1 Tax=hydrothermal vent metagenome TaxID=652676 RepID=A0A3B1DP37_9ZZZZ
MRSSFYSRLICLLALFIFIIFASGCSKNFVYYPEKELISSPSNAGLDFKDLSLTTEDGVKINAWYVPYRDSEGVLLWFHGNAGNMGNRVNLLKRLHEELKINILLVDYRGYGKSEGEISEEGTAKDALAAYDYLLTRRDINLKQIFIFGRSLGSAVAVRLASEVQSAGLILEAPFTSVRDMVSEVLPWLPFKGLISIKYDSLSKIKSVKIPLLIMHGDQDKVIPYKQGEALFAAANTPKTFYTVKGAAHNNAHIVGGRDYFEIIAKFIDENR